jgi:Uma2 family endonuclease
MVAQVNPPVNKSASQPASQPVNASPQPTVVVSGPARYSPEEYLVMEVESADRHEYRDGEIVLMTGAMPNHNRISRNLSSAMTVGFEGKDLEVFAADQRLWIPLASLYTYPDLMVIAGELTLQPGRKDTAINPLMIVEVLSKSTQAYDRTDKFAAYRSISGFQEYLLVDQYRQKIEQHIRTSAKTWVFQEYDETDTLVRLQSIGLDIPIATIYNKVKFVADTEVGAEADREVGAEPVAEAGIVSDQPS